jgi:hypothetical protein
MGKQMTHELALTRRRLAQDWPAGTKVRIISEPRAAKPGYSDPPTVTVETEDGSQLQDIMLRDLQELTHAG